MKLGEKWKRDEWEKKNIKKKEENEDSSEDSTEDEYSEEEEEQSVMVEDRGAVVERGEVGEERGVMTEDQSTSTTQNKAEEMLPTSDDYTPGLFWNEMPTMSGMLTPTNVLAADPQDGAGPSGIQTDITNSQGMVTLSERELDELFEHHRQAMFPLMAQLSCATPTFERPATIPDDRSSSTRAVDFLTALVDDDAIRRERVRYIFVDKRTRQDRAHSIDSRQAIRTNYLSCLFQKFIGYDASTLLLSACL